MEGFPATAASQFHKELRFFFSLLKRKKEAKKEKSSPTLVLYGNASHEDYTRNCHNRFSSTKLPRRGIQAAAAAVTLPFSQLKLGRKVSGDPPHAVTLPFLQLKLGRKVSGGLLSLGKSAIAISAGRRADPPLSLLKRKKEKSSPTIVLHGNDSHEDYTKNFFPHRFSSSKIPRRGEQAAAAAVTLPFLQLKLGRKVSGDPPPMLCIIPRNQHILSAR